MGFFQHRKMILQRSISNTTQEYTNSCTLFCQKAIPGPLCLTACSSPCPELCLSYLSPPLTTTKNSHSHKGSTFLTITIALLAASFLIVSLYALYATYFNPTRRRSRRNNDPASSPPSNTNQTDQMITREFLDEEHGATVDHHVWYIRTVGLDPSIIGSITAVKYKKDEGLIEGTDCSVCLSEFQEDETLRLLPKCSHAFHVSCIDTWLGSHTNCPMCRAPVVVAAAVKASSPPPETSSGGSGAEEEANSGSHREVEGDLVENESSVSEAEQRVEPSRRLVSLDCFDDKARTNGEKRVCGDAKKLQRLRSGGSSRNNGHGSSMKRSHSCNGKFVLCRPVRITDSVLPLRSI